MFVGALVTGDVANLIEPGKLQQAAAGSLPLGQHIN
jgi:hypothetical protein